MIRPGLQATTPERRRFIFVVGLGNCAFLVIDQQFKWPSPGLVLAGRLALSFLLFAGASLLGRLQSPAALRLVVRGLTCSVAAAFSVLVWGTGGSAGPYLAFLPLLALVVTVAVPDDPVATALAAGVCTLGGVTQLRIEGAPPAQLALWAAAFVSGGGYAVAGSLLQLRSLEREVLLEAQRDEEAARRLEARDREARAALDQELQSKQLEALHRFANDVFLLLTPEGDIVQANDRALEAYGYTEAELLALNVRDLRAPGGAAEVGGLLRRAVEQGGVRFTTRHRRGDGTTFPAAVSSRELRIGASVFLQSIIRDLTAEESAREAGAAAEAALQASQHQLLHAQKMEAVGRLASGVAHDFNNLLLVILSSSRELCEELPEGSPLRADAADILESGERAALLVKQLLAFSRKSEAKPAPTTLEAVVRGIDKLLRRTVGEDVAVTLELAPEPWSALVDVGQLEQVLMNLAVNARDAMPGGGALRISTHNRALEEVPPALAGLAPGRYVALEVRDTGHGMGAETLARAFEPFFTTKARDKGTGLGLSTVFGIVEQAGGRVFATSAPGRGTTFSIWLPCCDPAPPPLVSDLERRQHGRGEAVLVVEDDPAVRQSARRMLERCGFGVVEAGSAAAALVLLRSGARVEVVLSDMVMPGVSGAELAAALSRERPGLPVVLMTGYSDRAAPVGVPMLAKPFTERALVEQLLGALRRAGP